MAGVRPQANPPPSVVPRFAWLTDDGERTYRLEKFIEVLKTMMTRRGKTPSAPYPAAVEDLYRRWTET